MREIIEKAVPLAFMVGLFAWLVFNRWGRSRTTHVPFVEGGLLDPRGPGEEEQLEEDPES